VKQFIQIMYS